MAINKVDKQKTGEKTESCQYLKIEVNLRTGFRWWFNLVFFSCVNSCCTGFGIWVAIYSEKRDQILNVVSQLEIELKTRRSNQFSFCEHEKPINIVVGVTVNFDCDPCELCAGCRLLQNEKGFTIFVGTCISVRERMSCAIVFISNCVSHEILQQLQLRRQ